MSGSWFSEERELNRNLNTDGKMLQNMGMGDNGREKWEEYGSYFSFLKRLFLAFQCHDNELLFWVSCCKSTPFTRSKSSSLEENVTLSTNSHKVCNQALKQ